MSENSETQKFAYTFNIAHYYDYNKIEKFPIKHIRIKEKVKLENKLKKSELSSVQKILVLSGNIQLKEKSGYMKAAQAHENNIFPNQHQQTELK